MPGGGGRPRQRLRRKVPTAALSLSSGGKFCPRSRILHRWEFQRVQREGIRIRTAAFTVVALESLAGRPRLGMAVSKKIGSAPVRNRIKRLVRELFRRSMASMPPVDFVMIAQPEAKAVAAAGLHAMCETLLPSWGLAGERAMRRGRSRP